MEASKKVWIRGNDSRKEEVIKMLTDLGATNHYKFKGCGGNTEIYFINHDNNISSVYESENELSAIIKEEYKELTLPKKEYKFEPFDKVLVRDSDEGIWQIDFFSYKREGETYLFQTISSHYKQCIPYNEETKHLVGTADNW